MAKKTTDTDLPEGAAEPDPEQKDMTGDLAKDQRERPADASPVLLPGLPQRPNRRYPEHFVLFHEEFGVFMGNRPVMHRTAKGQPNVPTGAYESLWSAINCGGQSRVPVFHDPETDGEYVDTKPSAEGDPKLAPYPIVPGAKRAPMQAPAGRGVIARRIEVVTEDQWMTKSQLLGVFAESFVKHMPDTTTKIEGVAILRGDEEPEGAATNG